MCICGGPRVSLRWAYGWLMDGLMCWAYGVPMVGFGWVNGGPMVSL